MAGTLLDSLVDAFEEDSDDGKDLFGMAFPNKEVPGCKGSDEMKAEAAVSVSWLPSLSQAAEFMMLPARIGEESAIKSAHEFTLRAMQVTDPSVDGPVLPEESSEVSSETNPDEQVEYYRRMVQMRDRFEDEEAEPKNQSRRLEELMLGFGDAEKGATSTMSLQVCADFSRSGDCKAGVNCRFIHDGAFGRSADKSDSDVKSEYLFRRALQIRAGARKLKTMDPG